MESSSPRPYRMTARAEAAAQTGRDILAATVALWREKALDEITLREIADRADVSVQTVIRRFGSKEGVFDACIESDAGGVRVERDRTPAGDLEAAVETLISHYERDGDAVLRTLALEDRLDAAKAITERGRIEHRKWCTRVFCPYLPPPEHETYERRVDAFVAATDLYVWKLLRRDLGRSAEETKRTTRMLLDGLIS
ncbi:MAG: TetR/AcrR family transcriptional regulator [Rhodothermales bacterium]